MNRRVDATVAVVENPQPGAVGPADDYKNYLKIWEKLDISTLPI